MCSSAYLFLKRFYLNELIGLVFWVITWVIGGLWQVIGVVLMVFNVPIGDLIIDWECCRETIASPLINLMGVLEI